MPESLMDLFLKPLQHQANKHGLGKNYPEDYVRAMDNMEFLTTLSEAMEQYMAQFKQSN